MMTEQAGPRRLVDDVLRAQADAVPCGDDPALLTERIMPYAKAGFTEVAFMQIGGDHQEPFNDWARDTLLPELRRLPGKG